MKCKALTICQPYAELIMCGEKRVENRTWCSSYRYGPLLIHAGKSREWMRPADYDRFDRDLAWGALIGIAWVGGWYSLAEIAGDMQLRRQRWVRSHKHTNGPFCIVLENVRRFKTPLPLRGRQRLFDVAITPAIGDLIRSADPVGPQVGDLNSETPKRG